MRIYLHDYHVISYIESECTKVEFQVFRTQDAPEIDLNEIRELVKKEYKTMNNNK